MKEPSSPVLVSWIAFANDPYERASDGSLIPGPTLALLTDPLSPSTPA